MHKKRRKIMKKQMLFFVTFLMMSGCSMKCYDVPGLAKVCVSDKFSLRCESDRYLERGYSLLITKKFFANQFIVSSFYVAEEDTLYTKNDPDVFFTQLWYIKNKTLPAWPLRNIRFFEVRDIANFLDEN
jgi:hypothetical protein